MKTIKKWGIIAFGVLLIPIVFMMINTYVNPDVEGGVSEIIERPEVLQEDWYGRSGLIFFTGFEKQEKIFCQGHAIKQGLRTEVRRESCVPADHIYTGEGTYGVTSFNGQTLLRGFTAADRTVTVPGEDVFEKTEGKVKSWYAFVNRSEEVVPIIE
ncbi:hypothetical protein [Salimicrobium halophilum]|uniref:Uncharacterized protein n=1 Tax=Salimicrobium halophilum TaxID=86666 RepID=A0A1G8R2G6_9BACI|nr:hypothetical protein [Salimicrobium halophilum]SDJ11184.1 hypothetical protein SAMN04490247_0781 [Salimicrobium halophilum]